MNETDIFTPCPLSDVQPIVRGKWTMVIIYYLSQKTYRFGELSLEKYINKSHLK